MTNANIALARRFWMHVHEGGTLTTLDVGRMGTAMEELDAAFTNLHREYDKRGDRIEELKGKLKTSEEIGRAFEEDAGQLRVKLEKAMTGLNSIASNTCCDKCQEAALVARTTLAELTGGKDE